jgi:hypothetical protein
MIWFTNLAIISLKLFLGFCGMMLYDKVWPNKSINCLIFEYKSKKGICPKISKLYSHLKISIHML